MKIMMISDTKKLSGYQQNPAIQKPEFSPVAGGYAFAMTIKETQEESLRAPLRQSIIPEPSTKNSAVYYKESLKSIGSQIKSDGILAL